jgi:hypothetical protein
LADASV